MGQLRVGPHDGRAWLRRCLALILAGALLGVLAVGRPNPAARAQTSGLRVQYRAGDINAADNQIKPHLQLVNGSGSSVALSELKLRYWYTWEGSSQTQQMACDWAVLGCGNVAGSFVKLATAAPGADHYLEVSFSGTGTLAAGASSGEIQLRVNKSDWSSFNESGDYSFDPTKTAFADWSRVTLYRAGTLIWGTEPGDPPPPSNTPTSPSGVTNTPGRTNTPTMCPQATAEPLWVDPVTSPTGDLSQTIRVYAGRANQITVSSVAGTVTYTGPDFSPALITISLLPNTSHSLRVTSSVPVTGAPGCTYGGYTLSTTVDRNGNPLTIVQQSTNTTPGTSTTTRTSAPATQTRTSTAPSSANLLQNPGFETDASPVDGKPDGWGTNANMTRSSAARRSGTYSIRHQSSGEATYISSQVVPNIVPGASYSFSGWTSIPATGDAFTYRLELVWRNSGNGTISTRVVRAFTGTTSGAWTQASGTYVAPANTTNVVVRMNVAGLSATIYSDDFSLTRGASPTPPTATSTRTSSPAASRTTTATRTATTAQSSPTSTSGPIATPTSTSGPTATPGAQYIGNATHFDALGAPYGGCGIPQAQLETQNFLALNVQDTPGDYSTMFPRPISGANLSRIGLFNNGLNCGRWVRVTIGDYCNGINDGAPNQPFCRNGSGWTSDQYNGAVLDFIVSDSCQDGNAWCRDDRYHLDLATASLNKFVKNGQPVSNMHPTFWNNRRVHWEFIPAPGYTGDIRIGFIRDAFVWWSAIAITNLPNGIHGVEYQENGAWVRATMNSDMGQSYIIKPTVSGGTQYQIRVYDVADRLINNGRVYSFSMPAACGSRCSDPFTPVTYTTQ